MASIAGFRVWCAIALVGCTPRPQTIPGPVVEATAEDAAVYAAAIDSLFPRSNYTMPLGIVLVDTTTLVRRDDLVPQFWNALYSARGSDSTTVEDLERRGRSPIALRNIAGAIAARIQWRLELVSATRLASIPRTGPASSLPKSRADYFWDGFYQMFPHTLGTVSLSPVGYNRARNRAVLVVDHGCHSLCGEGHIVTLRRDSSGWHVVALLMTWVS